MRGASSLGAVTDSTNANTKRSREWRKARRAASAASKPDREARALGAARALVSAAASDNWYDATSFAREIRSLHNPAKDAPIAGVEVLLRSLVWIAEGASWGAERRAFRRSAHRWFKSARVFDNDDFGDAGDLLLSSSLDESGGRRRVDDALDLLVARFVDPTADRHETHLYVLTIVDGMRWHLRRPPTPEKMVSGFRDAPALVRRFAKELGGGSEAECLARRVLLCLEHPGHTIIIPRQRALKHPLAAIVITGAAWAALYRAGLGGDGRPKVSALVAPSTGGSGVAALNRARAQAWDWPENFAWAHSEGTVAREFKITPRVARVLSSEYERNVLPPDTLGSVSDDEIPF